MSISPDALEVVVNRVPVLRGELHSRIKAEDSLWLLEDGLLHILLLKCNRRACFALPIQEVQEAGARLPKRS